MPTPLQGATVNEVADQIEELGLMILQKPLHQLGPAKATPQMNIADEYRSHLSRTDKFVGQ